MRQLLPILFLAGLFAACSEDQHVPEPPQPIVQPSLSVVLPGSWAFINAGMVFDVYEFIGESSQVCISHPGQDTLAPDCNWSYTVIDGPEADTVLIARPGNPAEVLEWVVPFYGEKVLTVIPEAGHGFGFNLDRIQ